jgi:hypothetical protein
MNYDVPFLVDANSVVVIAPVDTGKRESSSPPKPLVHLWMRYKEVSITAEGTIEDICAKLGIQSDIKSDVLDRIHEIQMTKESA